MAIEMNIVGKMLRKCRCEGCDPCERPKCGSTARSGRSGRYAHAHHDRFIVTL